jgi:Prolyl oligopeptidase family
MNSKLFILLLAATSVLADGPKDNLADQVRPVPPPGIPLPDSDRTAITKGLGELRTAIDAAAKAQEKNPKLADLLPDVEIYHKAVDWALRYNEFLIGKDPTKDNKKDIEKEARTAHELLAEGKQRAEQLKSGQAPWTKQTGLVVRGYRSKIDGSVQPYGMVIPDSYAGAPSRLDAWCHGRGETLSELAFIDQRRKTVGQIAPANALVLHPYGRYCCANKFAGEIDLLEAIEHAKKFYAIDADRMMVRGFSMGGAAAWQFAVHYPSLWCAANPGAGFAETPQFLKVFQNEDVYAAPWYEQKLWRWYNATDHALNLFHCPTVAYSGEIDKQKQAADVMETALRGENIDILHIIGPQTAHKIHPDSLVEIERRLAEIASVGRAKTPFEVHYTTWMLRYNQQYWITVDELQEHWVRTRVHAKLTSQTTATIKTQNVNALTIDWPAGQCPLSLLLKPTLEIDGQQIAVTRPKLDRSWRVHLRKNGNSWLEALAPHEAGELVKKHGLQGPIDDAFMDSFVFVKPAVAGWNPKVDEWVKAEMDRAVFEWRRQFRGDVRVKSDTEITDADIAGSNLVLWGDPQSNPLIAKIAGKLPIKWSKDEIGANGKTHPAGTSAPVLIYPNPLNPNRYVVLNSSFTYREYDYLNNARQVAKLPDWAVIDISQPRTSRAPGGIADAGFFDEKWQWKPAPEKK